MKKFPTSIRFDPELLAEVEFIAKEEGIDKATWIKRAVKEGVRIWYEDIKKELSEDYIKLRIDDKEYKRLSKSDTVPKDIMKARESFLQSIVKSKDNE